MDATTFSFLGPSTDTLEESGPSGYDLPNYLSSADMHNVGNGDVSWLNPASWEEKLGNVGKFISVSVLSGINSFYNTGITVGRFAGFTNAEDRDTGDWITSFDTNLADYYSQNAEAADLTGFVLGSLIPGLGGIKILNAGQKVLGTALKTGEVGGTLSRALGLLVPKADEFLKLAAADIKASRGSLQLINTNTTKAIAAGFWQNTLEAAAFETVVQATMFKSPVLSEQDGWDIAKNIAIGGAFGGTIGGIFTLAKQRGALKAITAAEDTARMPFQARDIPITAVPPASKIISLAFDTEMAAVPIVLKNADGTVIPNNFAVNAELYKSKVTRNLNDIRSSVHDLTTKDGELANTFANILMPVRQDGIPVYGYANDVFSSMSGAIKIARATEITPIETAVARAIRNKEVPEVNIALRWVRTHGDDAGEVLTTKPTVLNYADTYIGKEAVTAAVRKDYAHAWKQKFEGLESRWSAITLKGVDAHKEAEARFIWANHMLKEVPDNAVIDIHDIPVLTRAFRDGQFNISVLPRDAVGVFDAIRVTSKEDLYQILKNSKEEVANNFSSSFLTKRGKQKKHGLIPKEDALDQIAKIVDVRKGYLEGNTVGTEADNLFATSSANRQYQAQLAARELSTSTAEAVQDITFLPKYGKVVYDVSKDIKATDGNILSAITHYHTQELAYKSDAQHVVARTLGKWTEYFPDMPRDKLLETIGRTDPSAGLLAADSAAFGTAASSVSFVGSLTRAVKQDFKKKIGDEMSGALVALGAKPVAAIERESINQKMLSSGKLWLRREDTLGNQILVERNFVRTLEKDLEAAGGPIDYELLEEGKNAITIKNQEVADVLDAEVRQTKFRTQRKMEMRATQGRPDKLDDEVVRPTYPDLKQYPHFTFVIDTRVTGTGHATMIHAASAKELEALSAKVPSQYKVLTKTEVEEFKKSHGIFEYSRTLNENYINHDLANNGVFSNFFPKSSPQKIIDDILQQHYRESDVLVSETVRLRYESEFALLEDLGREYSKFEASAFTSRLDQFEKTAKNPYFNLIKTALDITKINEHPLIYSANKLLDDTFSRAYGAIAKNFDAARTPAELEKINQALDEFGMKPAFYDADMHSLVNHSAPRGVLTKFVRGANALLSRFTLGLDPLNALNNAIGSNILRTTELKQITDAIAAGNGKIAGELAQLGKIGIPGTDSQILAPTKLIAGAIKNFWTPETRKALLVKYKDMQLIKDRVEQLALLVDDFTLTGKESVGELSKRMDTAFARAKNMVGTGLDRAEKYSGNPLAEEFNRFISANVMDQITGIAVRNGLMDEKTAATYINTFVNRVEGNIVASQRPLVFQGPIGQAISLFQSYQFNLLQQLFRYVGEGKGKDVAMLAGLQSTLYGLQSLPGFQATNIHILGNLSGNKEHKDAYDAVYGAAGRTAGDFLLYGLPSRLIFGWAEGNGVNIYSRGDINPRQLTILPTNLQEIPIVAGWGKFFGSMKETAGKIAGGGNVWESFLQGVEHNGISRPLAGLAQSLQAFGNNGVAYSTSSKGSILYQNDLMSLATLTRLAGGRPLDEALVNDTMFRVKSYEAARREDLANLAEKVKTTLIQGNQPDPEQLEAFTKKYTELGGKTKNFNKWMMELYKNANQSQASQMQQTLSSPYSYKLQLMMGGSE